MVLVGNHDSNTNNIRIFNNSDFESIFSFSGTAVAIRDSIFGLNNCDYSNDKRFSARIAIENVTFSTNGNQLPVHLNRIHYLLLHQV